MKTIGVDEILAVLAAVDPKSPSGPRDLALLSLMFNTGARVSEIVALQTDDLQTASAPTVVLRGKGRKERICPLWPETVQLLERMLEERGVKPGESAALFLNRRGIQPTRFGVSLDLEEILSQSSQDSGNAKG